MITEQTLQKIKDLPLKEVIGKYIQIKNDVACCPFHQEDTPSFRINEKKGIYKCFGCNESGDGIKFVQQYKNLSFVETIEAIGKAHSVNIEFEKSNQTPEERERIKSKTNQAKDCLAFAEAFYFNALQNNNNAKAYLLERHIDDNDIAEWRLGFAPDTSKNIIKPIIERGWYDVAIELGLIKSKEGMNYDVYRNRIIIPIHDKLGQLIGFGGRSLSDDKKYPKYINPADSFLYKKEEVLFGLHKAALTIKEENKAILQEGYFDVITSHKHELENAVASCGTALTDKQLKLIKRYTTNTTFMFDGDKAGQKAAIKSIDLALANDLNVFVVELTGTDPDQMAREFRT